MKYHRFFTFCLIVILLGLGACRNPYADPPLHEAAMSGDLDEVKRLIKSGVDVNAVNSEGATPLHWAAFKGRLEVARYLVSKGARVNATTHKGSTPLRLAKTHKQKDLIVFLENRGGE